MVVLAEQVPKDMVQAIKKAMDKLSDIDPHVMMHCRVIRDRALREWVLDETAENMHRNFGSGYPGDPATKAWLDHHKNSVFGFPTLVRFSWGTCTPYFKDIVQVTWESDKLDEESSSNGNSKCQLTLSNVGFIGYKKRTEEFESSGKGRCKFFQARKLQLVTHF